MPWSDDTRCLFCDGKLPLYRKLTQGQFCSKQHQKLYWEEQERLAVERLHQTHDQLLAYRPPDPIESILGPGTEPEFDDAPAISGILPETFAARYARLPDFVAADPFEYEMVVRPFALQPGSRVIDMRRTVRELRDAGPARLPFTIAGQTAKFSPQADTTAAAIEIEPVTEFTLSPVHEYSLAQASRVPLPFIPPAAIAGCTEYEAWPLEAAVLPVRHVASNLEPRHTPLEDVLLDQLPLFEKLRRLSLQIAMAGGDWLPLRDVPANICDVRCAPVPPVSSGLQGSFGAYQPVSAGLRALSAKLNELTPGAVRGETHPYEIRPLAPLTVRLSAPPAAAAYQPGVAGMMRLQAALQSPPPPVRPEAEGEMAAPMPRYTLPVYLRGAAPVREIRHKATKVQGLNYRASMTPQAGALKPRPVGPAVMLPLSGDPLLPEHRAEPLRDQQYKDAIAAAARASLPWVKIQSMVAHGIDFWRNAPRDLKLLTFAIPALLALVFAPALPKISIAAPQLSASFPVQIRQVVSEKMEGIRQSMANRAGVQLNEDFRQGLDDWISKGGATTRWSFDATGFVRPGPLALYAPSMNLSDYQLQFMGILDKQALSWVVRAKDFQNYYVVKLTVAEPGPRPKLRLTRYAVIDGRAQDRVDTRVPIDARNDTNYRIRMDVNGDDFSVLIQEQMIDHWTEPRLKRGGVGFYTASGESSRIRWVQVTHQYDMLGRLCAYLAPIDFPTTTGSW